MESPDSARHCAKDLTSDALAELLGNRDDLLILDCRSFIAFNKSHIAGAANVTCPTLLLKRLQQRSKKRRQSHSGRSQCVVLEKLVASQHEVWCGQALVGASSCLQTADSLSPVRPSILASQLRVLCSTGQVSTVVLYGDVGEEPLNSLLVLLTGDVAHLYYLSGMCECPRCGVAAVLLCATPDRHCGTRVCRTNAAHVAKSRRLRGVRQRVSGVVCCGGAAGG